MAGIAEGEALMADVSNGTFSEKVAAGSRTYFFDVKRTKDGANYLVISESRQTGEKREYQRLMVFMENLKAFSAGLAKAAAFMGGGN